MVHKGLGEMQALASGVGDLKKVLTNVKNRGTLGEIQLGALLDQILTPEQYAKNIATKKNSRDMVEYAIKLPGRGDRPLWLPVDAKFPLEDYQRLVEAQEHGDVSVVEEMGKALEIRIKSEAKDIRDKYVDPPDTSDFGILFLPFEGLFAEVLRRPGLYEFLQREYKVVVTGPTTIAALLNSLQMGFRTLAIEQRAGEVWNLLASVKSEFGKFGEMLDRTHKQLQAASNTIEDAAKKTRTIERRLKDVQVLQSPDAGVLLEPQTEKDAA
jgi:DNA recombination protein RmuC